MGIINVNVNRPTGLIPLNQWHNVMVARAGLTLRLERQYRFRAPAGRDALRRMTSIAVEAERA
jgi:hypothetical protein